MASRRVKRFTLLACGMHLRLAMHPTPQLVNIHLLLHHQGRKIAGLGALRGLCKTLSI
jgi:hypothetical protein